MLSLGVVPYLNALPLYWTLRPRADIRIIQDVPARLAARLSNGEFDAALLPVADYLRGAGEGLLGDAIIGATGNVRSVLIFSKVPIQQIESLALDTSSHSSVALTRVLMRDFYKISPRIIDAAPDLHRMLEQADAALLIGDPALEAVQKPHDYLIYDLANEWKKLTDLSFVFAAWTAKSSLENRDEIARILNQARDEGEKRIAEISKNAHSNLAPKIIENYLREAIEYHLSPAHEAGLNEFGRRLALI